MTKLVPSVLFFEDQIRHAFAFLEVDYKMFFSRVKEIAGDPRDSGIVARYRCNQLRVDVAWSETELSLAILIYLNRNELPRPSRYIYMDSYIEFIGKGENTDVVPQIYPQMSEKRIFEVMKKRHELFQCNNFIEVLAGAAERLHAYLPVLLKTPAEVIHDYHMWIKSKER